MSMKACSKCERVKPLEEFYPSARYATGRASACRECERARRRAYVAANGEKQRAYRETTAEERAAYQRRYYSENRERVRARGAVWYAENRDRRAQRLRELPHIRWAVNYRTRAREYGHPVIVEEFTRADVVDRYGDACAHCGGPFEELDHYPIPVAQGGPHTLENVRPSCGACNRLSWRAGATTKGKTA